MAPPETSRVHTFHLVELPVRVGARALARPLTPGAVPGLDHAETLALMRLGAPVVTPDRLQLRRIAVFAQWRDEDAVDAFLDRDPLGRRLATGWHVRLEYLRRWSGIAALPGLPARAGTWDDDEPVVAVTLARMRQAEVPRFLRWGRPVERLVRDHPGTTLALAAFRPPRTISTFSVWRSVREMEDMVRGRSAVPHARVHAAAMDERRRRDFHHEFATYRFRAISEHGAWQGRTGIVPPGPHGGDGASGASLETP
ncbi:hypothetical protein [uncultured Nocardioides sp.]|uniref:hypothetical protein n=1 Tax=uncultured Nocardioides sp. TaxID=198441 RepID=UPI002638D012|nr:hypothetical protein [uncultured Nocardioides sp.]